MEYNFMKDDIRIKKIVGKEKKESVLDRAFRFKLMLEEFRGKRPASNENVRRIVGRTQS